MAARDTDTETAKGPAGPKPAHILLDSISRALGAGVDTAQIKTMIDMCRMAKGVQQSPVWKMCALSLDEYTAAANAANGNQAS